MTVTTSYGTWTNNVEAFSASVEDTITSALGDYAHEYNIDALAAEYRQLINNALPESVSLCGDEFIGPYYAADCDFTGYPTDEKGSLDIKAIVMEVDGDGHGNFWALAERHAL